MRQSNRGQKDAPTGFHSKQKQIIKCKCEAIRLHAVPEVVCVEEAIELRIQIDDIDAPLCSIPNNGTGKVASVVVLFGVNAQAAVNTEFQSGRVLSVLVFHEWTVVKHLHDLIFSLVLSTLEIITLIVQLLQLFLQSIDFGAQSLGLNLELIGSLCDSELFRVQSQDIGCVSSRVVARDFRVVCCA